MKYALLLCASALLAGCNSTSRYTFDVSVKNATSRPLTVGFVKQGGSVESAWTSPEALAMLPPSRQPSLWGQLVPDGKTASVQISGEFARGDSPYLRVYGGARTMSELLAISRGTGDRIDLLLQPGHNNDFVVREDHQGRLSARLAQLEPPR